MPRQLTLSLNGGAVRKELPAVDLDSVGSHAIGRDPGAGLFLNDPSVSRTHCRIFVEGGRVLLEDLKSRAGTTVNGRAVTGPVTIEDGDRVEVGSVKLSVRLEAAPVTVPDDSGSITAIGTGADGSEFADEMIRPAGPPPVDEDVRAEDGGGGGARGDVTMVSRHRPRAEAASTRVSAVLKGERLEVGRDADCDLRVDSPLVSRRHARVVKRKGEWFAEDAGSSNGTFVNGIRLTKPRRLVNGDVIAVGSYRLLFDGTRLTAKRTVGGTRIEVARLGKQVVDRETKAKIWLLQDISLAIEPREFVGLMGGSGCGKSTFMDAVNGRRRATHGRVLVDGEDLYANFESMKGSIGCVPQDVIFHDGLPVEEALRYSAKLRLPPDSSPSEIESSIDRVLRTVGLTERRATLIRHLSGGQKKRVSIAMELLSRPQVLFLDEVTSGLDLGTERQMMELFRNLSDDGITVVCITHHVDSLEMCDVVAHFMKGRMTYFGPPAAFKRHFGIDEIREIYTAETAHPPVEWERRFRQSGDYKEFVAGRRTSAWNEGEPAEEKKPREAKPEPLFGRGFSHQLKTLTDRYLKLLSIDVKNLLLLLNLAPAVALLLCLMANSIEIPAATSPEYMLKLASKQNILCFGSVMTVMFLALFGSIREIVKEDSVYRHERFVNLQVLPYLLSKAVPLGVLGLVEALMVTMIVNHLGGLEAGSIGYQFLVLAMISVVGTLLGLAISAAVPTSDWAVILMVGVVIPQMLFSGALVPVRGASEAISKLFIPAYWAHHALVATLDAPRRLAMPARPGDDWGPSLGALPLHAAAYLGLAIAFLVAKDGHGALARSFNKLMQSLPKRKAAPAAAVE